MSEFSNGKEDCMQLGGLQENLIPSELRQIGHGAKQPHQADSHLMPSLLHK
jgi:hypothetical protein